MLVSLYSVSWQVANKGGESEGGESAQQVISTADANLDAPSIRQIFFFFSSLLNIHLRWQAEFIWGSEG